MLWLFWSLQTCWIMTELIPSVIELWRISLFTQADGLIIPAAWQSMNLNFDLLLMYRLLKAHHLFVSLLLSSPSSPLVHFLPLFFFLCLQRYADAAQALREVLKVDSTCTEARQELTRVQISQLMVRNGLCRKFGLITEDAAVGWNLLCFVSRSMAFLRSRAQKP